MKTKYRLLITVIVISFFSVISCSKREIFIIASEVRMIEPEYAGFDDRYYYLYKSAESEQEWKFFAPVGSIRDFIHESGYEYRLVLKYIPGDPEVMDDGNGYWQLINISSKVKRNSENLPGISN